jgi:CRISP-associated protein Cas1
MFRSVKHTETVDELLGVEGKGAAAYFQTIPAILNVELDPKLRFTGRNRRPPKDCFNAALSYGYGMLYRFVLSAIVSVGLHPVIVFYHQPRTSAHPLALDLMELFRVPLVDMPLVGAFNRKAFDAQQDFLEIPGSVMLNERGRRKMIDIFEKRLTDTWKHSVVGYSLSYARIVELEVRLLEKEFLGEGSLFAQMRLR